MKAEGTGEVDVKRLGVALRGLAALMAVGALSLGRAPAWGETDCTLYVATDGSDTNDGRSEASPLRTIQGAADVVVPGDVVCVRQGTYEDVRFSRGGVPGQPIVFRAYPGERPIIQEARGDVYGTIFIKDQGYIVLDGLAVRGGTVHIEGENAAFIELLNCDLDRTNIGIYHYAHDNLVKGCRVYDIGRDVPRGSLPGWGSGVSAAHGAKNNVFEDNYVYWIYGEGMSAFNAADGTVFRRNVIADSWSVNLYVDGSKDVIVEGNLIYLSPDVRGFKYAGPYRDKSSSLGIGVSVECAGAPTGCYVDRGERSIDGLTVKNNVVVNAEDGLRVYRNDNAYLAQGLLVANNTFVSNQAGILMTGTEVRDSSFLNNVVIQGKGGTAVAIDQPGPGLVFSHNLYFGVSASAFRWGTTSMDFDAWKAGRELTAQWADPMLLDSAAIPPRLWHDPALPPPPSPLPSRVDLAAPYMLTAASPAIDAGTSEGAPSTDFAGDARPQGVGVDLGADEVPAEGSSFADVPPNHWAYADIEKLYQGGYVVGCQATPVRKYCPEAALSRAEAAVFVERGVHGGGFLPPEPGSSVFSDVALGTWHAKWVHQLWLDGFTAGCATGPLRFCAEAPHTRAEATVFFLRMLRGKDYVPPEPGSLPYTDVARGTWYIKWVAAAYDAGLVQDCEDPANRGDDRFRPEEPITRAEAACMMAKAKGLS